MFGDVNPHVANKYLGTPKVHYPEVDQTSQSPCSDKCEPSPKILKIQMDAVGEM